MVYTHSTETIIEVGDHYETIIQSKIDKSRAASTIEAEGARILKEFLLTLPIGTEWTQGYEYDVFGVYPDKDVEIPSTAKALLEVVYGEGILKISRFGVEFESY